MIIVTVHQQLWLSYLIHHLHRFHTFVRSQLPDL
jgi:hypothetical protein